MGLHVPFVRMEVTFLDDPLCRVSLTLWVAGCSRGCPGCQNPELQDPSFGRDESVDVICGMAEPIAEEEMVAAVVHQGGDWMEYPEAYLQVAQWAQSKGLSNVLYTGAFHEDLPGEIQEVSDWIVDGPWDNRQSGVYPPSTNQRVFHRGKVIDPRSLPLYQHLVGTGSSGGGT